MKQLILGLTGLMMAGAANAAPALTDIEVGIWCRVPVEAMKPAPETTAGEISDLQYEPEIQWRQTEVPAVTGLSFGFKARAVDQAIEAMVRVTHPPFAGSDRTQEIWSANFSPLGLATNSYTIDFDFEAVQGDWLIEVISAENGDVLLSQPFTLVPASQLPAIAGSCNERQQIAISVQDGPAELRS